MNPLTVVVLGAFVVYSSAQLAPTGSTQQSASLQDLTSGMGPLSQMPNPTQPPSNGANNVMQNMLSNPLMALGMTGFDNPARAFMAPMMSRIGGGLPAYYFLRGGFDKMAPVMASDFFGNMLARSTGMNPMMSSMLSANMFDAPDSYMMTNMLFRGMGQQQQQQPGVPNLPNGAASGTMNNNNGGMGSMSGINPLLFMSMFT